MRNTYSPWEELASLSHIELLLEPIGGGILGEYDLRSSLIRLDPRMPRRQARSVLCHELRHVQFRDVRTGSERLDRKQERRADFCAARLLVNVHDLADAIIINGCQQRSAIAVALRVSLDVVEDRLRGLHPSERGYLRMRVDGHEFP